MTHALRMWWLPLTVILLAGAGFVIGRPGPFAVPFTAPVVAVVGVGGGWISASKVTDQWAQPWGFLTFVLCAAATAPGYVAGLVAGAQA